MTRLRTIYTRNRFGLAQRGRPRAAVCAAWLMVLLFGWGMALGAADALLDPAGETPFRVAISSRMFLDVHENDARAAVKVWAETLAHNSGVTTKPETGFMEGTPALIAAFREGKFDFVALATDEYLVLSREVPTTNLFSEIREQGYGEEYVLLVRAEGPVHTLTELEGRSLTVFESPRMGLGSAWLDVMLLRQGKARAEKFFGSVTGTRKLTTVILPVFFGKTDACLVTRSGFDAMAELNPQLSKQLLVVAASPRLVGGLTCFRANYNSPTKDKIMAGLMRLHETPAGHQILTVFQSGRIGPLPDSALQSARDLLVEHERLCGSNQLVRASPPPQLPITP